MLKTQPIYLNYAFWQKPKLETYVSFMQNANVEAFTSIKGDLETSKKTLKSSLLSKILFQ